MAETGTLNTVSAARALARHIREKYPAQRAEEIALKFGIEIARDEWTMANARVIYLAECSLRPPKIMLNLTAIRMLAERAQGPTSWQPGADSLKEPFYAGCGRLATREFNITLRPRSRGSESSPGWSASGIRGYSLTLGSADEDSRADLCRNQKQTDQQSLSQEWFTETGITEAVTAHELYHILAQQPSSPRNEPAAHAFAQELLRLPFSPQLYEKILLAE